MRFLIDMSASSFFIRKKKINKFHSGPKIESVFGSLDPTYMEESGAYEVREERDGLTKRNDHYHGHWIEAILVGYKAGPDV